MKKHIKKLICFTLITLTDFGITSNTEARLPQYMAKPAAELLIKKSGLKLRKVKEINDAIAKVVENWIANSFESDTFNKETYKLKHKDNNNIQDDLVKSYIDKLATSIFKAINELKTENHELVLSAFEANNITEHLYNNASAKSAINRACTHGIVEKQQCNNNTTLEELKREGVESKPDKNDKKVNEKTPISKSEFEKSIMGTLSKMVDDIIKPVLIDKYAEQLIEFLYDTNQRQELADYFSRAFSKETGKPINIFVEQKNSKVPQIFLSLEGVSKKTLIDGEFINQHFPCWTGTLTCFRLDKSSVAYDILKEKTTEYSQESITELRGFSSNNDCEKVVTCLFVLELANDWEDFKYLTGIDVEQSIILNKYGDPYNDCVPVPNTMYYLKNGTPQGSCMVSTIRNLLCILFKDKPSKNSCLKNEVANYIKRGFKLKNDKSIEDIKNLEYQEERNSVPGTTDPATLGKFAKIVLPNVNDTYQPTLDLFVCTLNNLLEEKEQIKYLIYPQDYTIKASERDKEFGVSTYQNGACYNLNNDKSYLNSIKQIIVRYQNSTPSLFCCKYYEGLIRDILQKITGHLDSIKVTLKEVSKKRTGNWPTHELVVIDEIINKKIIIELGQSSSYGAQHIEITSVKKIKKRRPGSEK